MNKAYEKIFQKLAIADKLAPFKIEPVKDNSKEWFDGEV